MQHVILDVGGLSCQHCVNSIESALQKAGAKGKVDLANGTVAVEYSDTQVSLQALKSVIEDLGYQVTA